MGFRPFVSSLARRLELTGNVRNTGSGVRIDVEGASRALDQFSATLVEQAPPLTRIEHLGSEPAPVIGYTEFRIAESEPRHERIPIVPPDVATCDDCLRELRDPADRRHGYPFLNCTSCGPRFTIITGVPYDRERTTMSGFAMCPACRSEYDDPRDRRFHAQPIACPSCGPRLRVTDANGQGLGGPDPLAYVATKLREGQIVAVKGLGGYHLACDATADGVVRRLRRRKQREAKPLALMVADLEAARRLCRVDGLEARLLCSARRPIVLLAGRPDAPIAESVAPGNRYLGLMLPSTPLHHLLLQYVQLPLVMTSGNVTDEPIAHRDEDARDRLSTIADSFLVHDREIHVRCDDSVTRVVLGRELPLRRARGDVPLPVRLPLILDTPILACGAQMKNTFCLAAGDHAYLSHHIGDLDEYRTFRSFTEGIRHLQALLGIEPRTVVHDLHPGYRSTQYASALGGVNRIGVQHHHAHIASCMVENDCRGPVIGVAFDGTGYGTDGHIWGGEFLLADYAGFTRLAHLEEIRLPGGDRAIRHPWRCAAAYLWRVYGERASLLELDVVRQSSPQEWAIMIRMLETGFQAPLTSSAGRLFDAVAALLGVRRDVQYEAQAAIELEMAAEDRPAKDIYPFRLREGDGPMVVETSGIITGIIEDVEHGVGTAVSSAKFHATMAEVIRETCRRIRARTGVSDVALSGGVFQNLRLLTETHDRLASDGFSVYRQTRVPPNDGGIALGQVAVAGAVLSTGNGRGQPTCA